MTSTLGQWVGSGGGKSVGAVTILQPFVLRKCHHLFSRESGSVTFPAWLRDLRSKYICACGDQTSEWGRGSLSLDLLLIKGAGVKRCFKKNTANAPHSLTTDASSMTDDGNNEQLLGFWNSWWHSSSSNRKQNEWMALSGLVVTGWQVEAESSARLLALLTSTKVAGLLIHVLCASADACMFQSGLPSLSTTDWDGDVSQLRWSIWPHYKQLDLICCNYCSILRRP